MENVTVICDTCGNEVIVTSAEYDEVNECWNCDECLDNFKLDED